MARLKTIADYSGQSGGFSALSLSLVGVSGDCWGLLISTGGKDVLYATAHCQLVWTRRARDLHKRDFVRKHRYNRNKKGIPGEERLRDMSLKKAPARRGRGAARQDCEMSGRQFHHLRLGNKGIVW